MSELVFALQIDDDWPPVSAECLPCSKKDNGYLVKAAPLFVKELSVGDIIQVSSEKSGQVNSWSHIYRSNHSTVWLLAFGNFSLEEPLSKLRSMGCNTTSLDAYKLASVDIPPSVQSTEIDEALGGYSEDDLAIAYPSWRHQ